MSGEAKPISGKWYWVKTFEEERWFPAFFDFENKRWSNGDWVDWSEKVIEWHGVPFALPGETPPTKWASITPRFEGDEVRRAPIVRDCHDCTGTLVSAISFGVFHTWMLRCSEKADIQIYYCPYCGGKLPTEQEHE